MREFVTIEGNSSLNTHPKTIRLYIALMIVWMVVSFAGMSELFEKGSNEHVVILFASVILGVLFFLLTTSIAFEAAPSPRAGARVYLARHGSNFLGLPLILIGGSFMVPSAGSELIVDLAGHEAMLSRSIIWALLALVFNVPFAIVSLVLFRRMLLLGRVQVVYCLGCGQDLTGISSHVCPECGTLYKEETLQVD